MEERNVGEPSGEFAEDETVGASDRPNDDLGVALLDEPSRCRDQPMDICELRAFGNEFDRAPGDCRVLNAGDDSVISNAGATLDQWSETAASDSSRDCANRPLQSASTPIRTGFSALLQPDAPNSTSVVQTSVVVRLPITDHPHRSTGGATSVGSAHVHGA